MAANFSEEKMYTFLKGYCMAKHWNWALNALAFARKLHAGQFRKSGQPYIIHPLSMACHAIALSLDSESVIAACLLHDVVEDCNVVIGDLPVPPVIQVSVFYLTHFKGVSLDYYYHEMEDDQTACIVKLLDRCDNVSTMAGVFSQENLRKYIVETRKYVLPLLRTTKDKWPVSGNALFVLKYHIMAVIDGIEYCLQMDEEGAKNNV